MNDDINTPRAIASIWELAPILNSTNPSNIDQRIGTKTLSRLKSDFHGVLFDVFGLQDEMNEKAGGDTIDGLMQLIIELRAGARAEKNWGVSDKIRDGLQELDIQLKDGKDGTSWSYQ